MSKIKTVSGNFTHTPQAPPPRDDEFTVTLTVRTSKRPGPQLAHAPLRALELAFWKRLADRSRAQIVGDPLVDALAISAGAR